MLTDIKAAVTDQAPCTKGTN